MDPKFSFSKRLHRIESRLRDADQYWLFGESGWWDFAPNRPGIYALWNRSETAVYVGASSNLLERIRDNLGSPGNHTFPNQIQRDHPDLKTRVDVRDYIRSHYWASCISLTFGRAEAEEYLVTEWKTYKSTSFNSPIHRRWRCDA